MRQKKTSNSPKTKEGKDKSQQACYLGGEIPKLRRKKERATVKCGNGEHSWKIKDPSGSLATGKVI